MNISEISMWLNFQYYSGNNYGPYANNKLWVRGSESNTWVQVYDLGTNEVDGSWKNVTVDLSSALRSANQQLSTTFQVRFGQQTIRSSQTYTFDDISVYVIAPATTAAPTTAAPTTAAPTTAAPTTAAPTTAAPTTAAPTTAAPTTAAPTTVAPTTAVPTTAAPTTIAPTTAAPTTAAPTISAATTVAPTTAVPTTKAPTTASPTSATPTDAVTTEAPTLTATETDSGTVDHIMHQLTPLDSSIALAFRITAPFVLLLGLPLVLIC
jgi:hypothetical protein